MARIDCAVCGGPRGDHKYTAHKFSENGELETKEQPAPQVIGGPDHGLRLLLMQKGLITAEELKVTEEAIRDSRGNPPQLRNSE